MGLGMLTLIENATVLMPCDTRLCAVLGYVSLGALRTNVHGADAA